MLGSLRAFISVVFNPKSSRLGVTIDGYPRVMKTPALIVSNNVYEDLTPAWKPANLDDGLLGIYALRPMPLLDYLKLAFDLLRGQWRRNLNVDEWQGQSVKVKRFHRYRKPARHITITADGELMLMEIPVSIEIEPRVVILRRCL